jgi:hypothetical protein
MDVQKVHTCIHRATSRAFRSHENDPSKGQYILHHSTCSYWLAQGFGPDLPSPISLPRSAYFSTLKMEALFPVCLATLPLSRAIHRGMVG